MGNRMFSSKRTETTKITLSALARYVARDFGRAKTKRILDEAGVEGHVIRTPTGGEETKYWLHEAIEAIRAYRLKLNAKAPR